MSRGDSLARQLQLIQILDERRQVSVPEVARELGYTTRTLYRDLAVLERVGIPIYQERVGNAARWRVVEGYRRRLSLTLSWSEVLALTAGRRLLEGLSGSMFHECAVSALDKIRHALPEPLAARVEAAASLLSASSGAAHDYTHRDEIVQRLVEAIERRETVELKYRKPGGSVERRRVDPLHMHIQAGALYMIGYSHERRQIRTFLADRAAEVTLTGRRFERKDLLPCAILFKAPSDPGAASLPKSNFASHRGRRPLSSIRKCTPAKQRSGRAMAGWMSASCSRSRRHSSLGSWVSVPALRCCRRRLSRTLFAENTARPFATPLCLEAREISTL
jgi:predicted DNA-binding transcriptional regulator YafY